MQAAHGADVVVAEKAQNEVAFAQQIAALLRGQLRVLLDGCQQQRLQLQHFRDLPPCEHPAHQHQNGKGIGLQRFGGAFVQCVQHNRGLQRRQQDARIAADDAQQRVVILTFLIGGDGVEILPVLLIPEAKAFPIEPLRLLRHRQEAALGARLHHVVEAIGHAIRQACDKGVLLGQHGEKLLRVRIACDSLCHFDGKLVGKSHDGEKLPLLFRRRIDHGSGEGGIDVGMAAGQHAALGERAQIQIYGGEPALAGIEKAFDLRIGKLRAAAMGIDGKLRMVEAELLCADLIYSGAQPYRLCGRQKAVAAGDDQMHIDGQTVCEHTEKQRSALVRQQVEIVDKEVAGRFARQRVAEIVHQQPAARGVRGAGVFPQEGEARAGESILHAFPEDGQIVGIHTDADHLHRLQPRPLLQIPVYRRGLSIAHGRDHRGHRAAGDGTQALLKALGYVNGVQVPFRFRHGMALQCALTEFNF